MSKNSAARDLVSVVAVGTHGFILFRAIQQLRRRAVNPDMKDLGLKQTRWLPAIIPAAMVLVVGIGFAAIHAWGAIGVFVTLICALVVMIAAMIIAAWVWLAAEDHRRKVGYVICEADYGTAPRQIKSTMRRIYRSAQVVRTGRAYQEGMFGELELDRLVFSAAEQAIVSSQIACGIKDLKPDSESGDRELIAEADGQIKQISAHLSSVESTLKRAATTANRLSSRLAEPARQEAARKVDDAVHEAAQDRRRRAREKLEEATTQAKVKTRVDATDVEERIAAVSAGYDEATGLTNRTRHQEEIPTNDSPTRAATAAKESATRAAKRATALGKSGAKKLRDRVSE